jgi:two-component system LytT family response regulator
MKIVIIEDESAAARNLAAIVRKVIPGAEIVAVLEGVEESVEWLGANPVPGLLLVDIHLADGESLRIFERVEVTCPIIFTTAYDQYALEAFKVNSIDYLLKPIKAEELRRAIEKLRRLSGNELAARGERISRIARDRGERGEEQKIFLIPVRDKIIPLRIEQVAFFYTTDEKVTATDLQGTSLPMDRSLDKLSKILSEDDFFRANRQFIVARNAVTDISVWFGNRLSLNLKVKTPERIIVSKDRVPEFKRWFIGKGT